MEEKTILNISLICVILGLFFLFLYVEEFDAQVVEQLEMIPPEEEVMIKGIITKMSRYDTTVFLEVAGERIETMDVVVFPEEEIFLTEGAYVKISGMVEEYQGKKELIASKIVMKWEQYQTKATFSPLDISWRFL